MTRSTKTAPTHDSPAHNSPAHNSPAHNSPAHEDSAREDSGRTWCRVLVVEHGTGLWGAQLYLLRLAPLMAARGVELVLAAPATGALARAWSAAGLPAVPLPVSVDRDLRGAGMAGTAGRVLREVGRNLAGAGRLTRLARRVGADVLHANSHGWAYTEVVTAAAVLRRPAVLHVHEEVEPSALGRVWALAIRLATATVGVSPAVPDSLPRWAASRVTVIPNGVDTELFAPGTADPGIRAELTGDGAGPVVLVLARLVPLKGIEDVIRAVATLPEPLRHTRLAIAGASADPVDVDYEARLHGLGRELLGDRIRFLGIRSDPADLIRAADVVALGSRSEGFGLCVLEAQACGKPVVAYPAGGVAYLIQHGEDGLLAQPFDVADLSAQLARVLAGDELAERLGAAARDRVVRESSLQRQADAQVALVRTLINRAK